MNEPTKFSPSNMVFFGGMPYNGRYDKSTNLWLNEYGEPHKSKHTHPYSYDPILMFGSNDGVTSGVYSDRLYQWDVKKYNKCRKSVFGDISQYWSSDSTEDIEKFLREYFDKPNLTLLLVVEYCNVSSGYPVWYFGYKD